MASKVKHEQVELPAEPATEVVAEAAPVPAAPVAPPAAAIKTAEEWAEIVKPARWLWPSARFLKGWAIGQEITRAEFEAAIEAVKTVEHR